jgi:hypothetical protein
VSSTDDQLDRYQAATESLLASPSLLKSWHEHACRETAYGRYLLDNSWKLLPSLPSDLIPHKPILRIWENFFAGIDFGIDFRSLTVFLSEDSRRCLVREGRWRTPKNNGERIHAFVSCGGEINNATPEISVRDANVPFDQLRCMLDQLAEIKIPFPPMEGFRVSTDSPHQGFEWMSRGKSPARMCIQWSIDPVEVWFPVVECVSSIRDLLCASLESGSNPTE